MIPCSRLVLTSALLLALSACSRSPAPVAEEDKDPPIPVAPVEVPAEALEQARQAHQVFVTLHAKPGQPALPEVFAQGDRWVDAGTAPITLCLESTNSTPVLVALSIQGADVDQRPATPAKARLLELNKGRIVCPLSDFALAPAAPQAIAWAVYPTNGQPVEALAKEGFLKDAALAPGGQGMIRLGTPSAEPDPTRPEVWAGQPEATPAPLSATEQAALAQILKDRADEDAKKRARPKPEGVEASS